MQMADFLMELYLERDWIRHDISHHISIVNTALPNDFTHYFPEARKFSEERIKKGREAVESLCEEIIYIENKFGIDSINGEIHQIEDKKSKEGFKMKSKICPHCKNKEDKLNVCQNCGRPFSPWSDDFDKWAKQYIPSDEKRRFFINAEQLRCTQKLTKKQFWEEFGPDYFRPTKLTDPTFSWEEFDNEEEDVCV